MNKTNIAWTNFTWNPLIGCTKVSDGCKNCYAEIMASRLANMWKKSRVTGTENYTKVITNGSWNGNIILDNSKLNAPSKRKKPTKIFVGSMTDIFHENTKWSDIDEIIKVIINNPQHTFQIITKRPERMREYFSDRYELNGDFNGEIYDKLGHGSIPNLWLGVSVENQKEADSRIPILLDIKASVRFLSVEPMIDRVDLRNLISDYAGVRTQIDSLGGFKRIGNASFLDTKNISKINWVIIGGESGTKSKCREFKYEWAEKVYKDCSENGTSFFFKQRGSNHNFKKEFDFEEEKEFPVRVSENN